MLPLPLDRFCPHVIRVRIRKWGKGSAVAATGGARQGAPVGRQGGAPCLPPEGAPVSGPAIGGGRGDDDGGGSGGSGGGGGPGRQSIVVNTTIFLPIPEGAFVNADNPLLMWDQVASDRAKGVHCGMYVLVLGNHEMTTTTKATTYSSTCNVEFFHPGAIDIEQPSFACLQYVVAYRLSRLALLDPPLWRRDGNGALLPRGGGGGRWKLSSSTARRCTCGIRPPSLHRARRS